MKNELQEIRRSTAVTTFGPGSVVDFRAGGGAVSGVAAGLEEWDRSFPPPGLKHPQTIQETRLQKKLSVDGFRSPPVKFERGTNDKPDLRRLVAVRFPKWLQCPRCDTIKPERRWMSDPGKAYRYCASCTAKSPGSQKELVIPVRFVMACKDGHLDEFPWDLWVGHKDDCDLSKITNADSHPGLKLIAKRPGLAGLILSCPKCNASRSMDGVFSKKTWENAPKCKGRRPWIANGDQDCGKELYTVQRGASNLYFPVTESALSIPPWTDRLQEAIGPSWATLTNLEDMSKLEDYIELLSNGELKGALEELDMSPAELAEAVRERLSSYDQVRTDDLRPAEYRQFVSEPGRREDPDNKFETRREKVTPEISPYISRVVRAVRLREVRAIRGFTRISPPGSPDSSMASLSKTKLNWLPAIEVRGEGIFLSLNGNRLLDWEKQPSVVERVSECVGRHRRDHGGVYGGSDGVPSEVTARYMLCHTLSHVLMRQLTLECGYSSAALQERIYAGNDPDRMAGLLIYTATPDSDGTLGGLERQGKVGRIEGVLKRSIEAIEWCSSDPLCISDMMGASNSCSSSVCHACCLAPETSCEVFNFFLDRALLIGTNENPELGFFRDILGECDGNPLA